MERYYFDRTFSLRIDRPDPGLLAFKAYLASFEGALPYVRVLRVDVSVVLDNTTPKDAAQVLVEGRMIITLINGFLRVAIRPSLVEVNPDGLTQLELMRTISASWVDALKDAVKAQQEEIERTIGAPEKGWIGVKEGPTSYWLRW